jgi:predicted lipase
MHFTFLALLTSPILAVQPFDADTFKRMVQLSRIAICSTAGIISKTCQNCNNPEFQALSDIKVNGIPGRDTQYYTGFNAQANEIVVSVRGTRSMRNWVTDLDALMVAYQTKQGQQMRLHVGFKNNADLLLPKLQEDIRPFLTAHRDAKLTFTGHSAGGAYASLLPLLMLDSDFATEFGLTPSRMTIVTIAQPKAGDQNFAQVMNSLKFAKLQRLVNFNDIVPRFPFQGTQLGYEHFDIEGFIGPENPEIPVSCTNSDLQSCNNRLPTSRIVFTNIATNHVFYMGFFMGCVF